MGFVLKRHFAIHTIIPCFTYDQLYSCCAKVTQNTKVINSPLLINIQGEFQKQICLH